MSTSGSYKPFSGDFNGDGSSDIFAYQPGNEVDTLWFGGGSGSNPFSPNSSPNISGDHSPVVADFDNDGDPTFSGTDRRWAQAGELFRMLMGRSLVRTCQTPATSGSPLDTEQRTELVGQGASWDPKPGVLG